MNAAPSTNATTSRLTAVVSYGVLLLLIYLVFRIAEPFLSALAWAAILVTFFYPMHKRLAKRFSATRASVVSTLAVTVGAVPDAVGFPPPGTVMFNSQVKWSGFGGAAVAPSVS